MLQVVLYALFLVVGVGAQGPAPVVVCVPGALSVTQIQQDFETTLGAGRAIVFGRIKDVENMLATSPNSPILVPGEFASFTPAYKVVLKGRKNGQTGQKYVALASNPAITSANLGSYRIAMVDFLGRENLVQFLSTAFSIATPKLKKTNKPEDLLILLGMESADVIIVPEGDVVELKAGTKTDLKAVAESISPVPYPVLAAKNGVSVDDVVAALMKQPPALLKDLGIDKWEKQ